MDFRNSTRNKKIEHWLIVVLISSLCLGLNFFVSKSNWQVDLSSETRYSLSRESIALLNKLQEPVEIIVTIKEKNNLRKLPKNSFRMLSFYLERLKTPRHLNRSEPHIWM